MSCIFNSYNIPSIVLSSYINSKTLTLVQSAFFAIVSWEYFSYNYDNYHSGQTNSIMNDITNKRKAVNSQKLIYYFQVKKRAVFKINNLT